MTLFKKIKYFVIICFPVFLFSVGFSQQHNIKRYSVEQGIQAEISCLMQDSRGYIWIGTKNGGLNRYDGKTFINYSKEDGLSNLCVNAICEDLNGKIWVGTLTGLDCFYGKQVVHYTVKNGLSDNEINFISKDKKGNLWFSTGNGLTKYDGKKFQCYYKEQGLSNTKVSTIFIDSKDNLWISYRPDKGIYHVDRFDGKNFKAYSVNGFNSTNYLVVNSIKEDKNGRIWLGTYHPEGSGLYILQDDTFHAFKFFNQRVAVKDFVFDKHSAIWLTTDRGIFKSSLGDITKNIKKNELVSGKLDLQKHFIYLAEFGELKYFAAIQDRNANLWFGSESGVIKYAGDMFVHYGPNEGIPSAIYKIFQDSKNKIWVNSGGMNLSVLLGDTSFTDIRTFLNANDNSVKANRWVNDSKGNFWIGTQSSGLFVYNGEKLILIGEKNGLKKTKTGYPRIIPAVEDKNGKFWFITNDSLTRLSYIDLNSLDFKINSVLVPELTMKEFELRSLLIDKKGRIWFSNVAKGFGYIDSNKLRWITIKDGVDDNTVGRMFEDNLGRIWTVSWSNIGINLYENGKFTHLNAKNGFTNDGVYFIMEDSFGRVWFSTRSEGLFYYQNNKFIHVSTKNGLNDNTIWNMLQDKNKNIWVGTNKGINKIILDSKGEIVKIKSYGYNEGFTGIECNQDASFEDKDGNLWFGTPSGLTKYIPSEDSENNVAPILNFNDVKLFYKETDWSKFDAKINSSSGLPTNLTLPYDQNNLTFSFIGIDFRSPDKVRYKFMLEGQETKWSPELDKNEVTFSSLSPGTYVFKVKSRNADGVWNKTPISFAFTITPPWWQTKLFYTVSGIGIIAIFFLFIKWREKKLQRQKLILENKVTQRTEQLNEKTKHLEEAYKHITDSINYAKKIQQAILPPHDLISASLRDYFIIYMPKDVVSGDYYAFFKKDDEIIIATADCTGHGVPGAFMSMIGNEQLGKIIIEKGITNPAKVLDELHNGIRKALKQDVVGGESRDGMDIALCKFNLKQKTLEYSGANRPLWTMRNNEITEIKANKQAIGGLELENRNAFTNHVIQLSSGDRIYTFTDGFADQFGGDRGKKFMLKNLEKLILSVAHLSMKEQAEKLKAEFEIWKGIHEQVDDVLLIGILV